MAQRENWVVEDTVIDDGVSAWSGENILSGALSMLLEKLERDGGSGRALIVEKLDRLSRQSALTMIQWLQRFTATGITIFSSDGRHKISAESLINDQIGVIALIFDSFRGFEESQVKSKRISAAWEAKRQRGAAMTAQCPAWVRPVGSTSIRSSQTGSSYELISDRAGLVMRIFKMAADGYGYSHTARTFNEERISPWGRATYWHASYIKKILSNPAVIGNYQPHTKPRGGQRTPIGNVITGYFPAAVSRELFYKVNEPSAAKLRSQQQSQTRLANLLAGLIRCGTCGGSMLYMSKGTDTLASGCRVKRRYLKCSNHHRGIVKCKNNSLWNYDKIESSVLDELLQYSIKDSHLNDKNKLSKLITEQNTLKSEIIDIQSRQRAIIEFVSKGDKISKDHYRELSSQEVILSERLDEIASKIDILSTKPVHSERVRFASKIRKSMTSDDDEKSYEARRFIKLSINETVQDILFHYRGEYEVYAGTGTTRIVFDKDGHLLSRTDMTLGRKCTESDSYISNINNDDQYTSFINNKHFKP